MLEHIRPWVGPSGENKAERKENDSARKVSKVPVGRTKSNPLSVQFIKPASKNIQFFMGLKCIFLFYILLYLFIRLIIITNI